MGVHNKPYYNKENSKDMIVNDHLRCPLCNSKVKYFEETRIVVCRDLGGKFCDYVGVYRGK